MRAADIDMSGVTLVGVPVWIYKPAEHKTEHHEHDRAIFLGPKAQAVVRPRLTGDPGAPLFSSDSPRRRRKPRPFTVSGYRQALARAWEQAVLVDVVHRKPELLAGLETAWAARRAAETAYAFAIAQTPKPPKAERKRLGEAVAAAGAAFGEAMKLAADTVAGPRQFSPHRLRTMRRSGWSTSTALRRRSTSWATRRPT